MIMLSLNQYLPLNTIMNKNTTLATFLYSSYSFLHYVALCWTYEPRLTVMDAGMLAKLNKNYHPNSLF